MSIERAGSVNFYRSFNKPPERQVTGDHSSSMIAQDRDQDGFMSLDELRIKNKLKDAILGSADLNGDGIISMREAVLASSSSSGQSMNSGELRAATEGSSKTGFGKAYSAANQFTEHLKELKNSQYGSGMIEGHLSLLV